MLLVKYYEIKVISLAPTPRHEVVTSEYWHHSTWTGEEPADPRTHLHIGLRVKRMTDTVSGEGESRDQTEIWSSKLIG